MSILNLENFPRRISSLLNPIKVSNNLKWRFLSKVSYEPHVFVVGAPRSGTTLMFTLILAHPNFCGINAETFFFVPRDALNLENYQRILEPNGLDIEEMRAMLKSSNDLIDLYDRIAATLRSKYCGKRFLEKTPFHALYLNFLIQHFPNARFINMIRDGRDCYVSNQRLDKCFHSSVSDFSKLWKKSINSRQILGENSQVLDIKYESLTSEPEKVMRKVMMFLEEEFFEGQIDPTYYSNSTMFEGYSGHERLKEEIKPFSIGKWREKMTQKDIEKFSKIAKKELLSMGYSAQ